MDRHGIAGLLCEGTHMVPGDVSGSLQKDSVKVHNISIALEIIS